MAAGLLLYFFRERIRVTELHGVLVQPRHRTGSLAECEDLLVGARGTAADREVAAVFRPERAGFLGRILKGYRAFVQSHEVSSHSSLLVVKPFVSRNNLPRGVLSRHRELAVSRNSLIPASKGTAIDAIESVIVIRHEAERVVR